MVDFLVRNRAATYYDVMAIHTINIDEAKDHFFDLIATTAEGGEVIITDNGKALARLIPATDAAAYQAHPPTAAEFSTDGDPLAWDADGWENVA
jgi:prevent-host-death family protein